MKLPNLLKLPYAKFTWKDGHGVAEASDLGFRAGQAPYAQVYDDACDVGFEIEGKHSTRLFTCVRVCASHWYFQSTEPIVAATSSTKARYASVTIYND